MWHLMPGQHNVRADGNTGDAGVPGPNDIDVEPNPKAWGRRPYADKEAREQLNDISRCIARKRPDDVRDPDDPSLSDVIRHADELQGSGGRDPKARTLAGLMEHGLTFQEAVCWYWFRHSQMDLTEIHFAIKGINHGGDPAHRRNSVRNIQRVLESAAFKLPDEDPDDVPTLDVADIDA